MIGRNGYARYGLSWLGIIPHAAEKVCSQAHVANKLGQVSRVEDEYEKDGLLKPWRVTPVRSPSTDEPVAETEALVLR
jgi:hypothetical protein